MGRKVTYLNRGYLLFRIRNNSAALADFTSAIKLDPDFTEAYLNRGDAYRQLGNILAALDDYAAVIEIDDSEIKNIATADALWGEIFESKEDPATVFYKYDRALLLVPDIYHLHHKRAT